jgi:beta-galactosidase
LDPELTLPLARFGPCNGWLDGHPAVTAHPYGKGMVFYVGAYLDLEAQQDLVDHILAAAGIEAFAAPEGIEIRRRTNPSGEIIHIAINHTRVNQSIPWPWPAREHLTNTDVEGSLELRPYGVAVLTRAAA